jgi:hypothetical protein
LVTNFEEEYKKAQELERTNKIPLWEAEKAVFGATHAEVGAYLIGNWGMPLSLAETTCYHHYPSLSEKKEIGSLTVVHAANALIYENQHPDSIPPKIDEAYFAELGLEGHPKAWRELLSKGKSQKLEVRAKTPSHSLKKEEVKPVREPLRPVMEQPESSESGVPRWAIIALTVGGLLVIGLVCKHLFFHL